MDVNHSSMQSAEYNTLRSELLQNKQYVFERPLLIITAAGVAAVQLSDKPSVLLLPLLLIIVLLINLWFTVNRLKSMARIAAYTAVILESATHAWIGWENALRKHRIWTKVNNSAKQKDLINKHYEPEAIPDAMMFYGPLLLLHVATVIICFSVSAITLFKKPEALQIGSFLATLAVTCVFATYCIGPYKPSKMRDLIEVQRAIWIEIFILDKKFDKTEHQQSSLDLRS